MGTHFRVLPFLLCKVGPIILLSDCSCLPDGDSPGLTSPPQPVGPTESWRHFWNSTNVTGGVPASALKHVMKLWVCVIHVGLPFAPLHAHAVHRVVAYALSTRPSPVTGLSSGFVDARQRGSRAKGKECLLGLLCSLQGFFLCLPSTDKQLWRSWNSSSWVASSALQPMSCWRRWLGFTLCTKIILQVMPGTQFWFCWRKHGCCHHPCHCRPSLTGRGLCPCHLSLAASLWQPPRQPGSAP